MKAPTDIKLKDIIDQYERKISQDFDLGIKDLREKP